MTIRRLFLLAFGVALLVGFGCSSSDYGNNNGAPTLGCSDGGTVAADAVTLSCGGTTDSVSERVDVVMGGTASGTTTLRGLNFDVTYDASKVSFTDTSPYTSPLFPDALIAVSLFNGQQGRVVVSIQQPGGLPDVQVAPGERDVLSLSFTRVTNTAFNPSALLFANTEATAASVPIAFTNSLAISYL